MSRTVPAALVARFGDALLAVDLPALDPQRRAETVEFVAGRAARMPSPMRVGVTLVAALVDGAGRLAGRDRVAGFVARRPLPVLADYVRLVRSLGYAHVWERWPDTAPDGAGRP